MRLILILFLSLMTLSRIWPQETQIDSLKGILKGPINDSIRMEVMNKLISLYLDQNQYQDSAYKEIIRLLDLTKRLGHKGGIASAYNKLGFYYNYKAMLPQALHSYLEALKLFEQINKKTAIAKVCNNIGTIYSSNKDYKLAITYFERSLQIKTERNDKQGIAASKNNLALIFTDLKDYSKAKVYFLEAAETNKELKNNEWLSNNYDGLASIYKCMAGEVDIRVHRKSFIRYMDTCSSYRKMALDLRLNVDDGYAISSSYNNMGMDEQLRGNYRRAKELFLTALPHTFKAGAINATMKSYEGLTAVCDSLSENKDALIYYRNFIRYRDSLNNEENTKQMVRLQMQYNFDKVQVADSIKNAEHIAQEQLKHEQQIDQQRTYSYGGVLGFGLMLVVALVSFRAYKQKQKDNHIISEQKALVEEKQKEILDSIHYARRIQSALITPEKKIGKDLERLNS